MIRDESKAFPGSKPEDQVSNPSVTDTNFPEFDRDAGENLIAESSDR